jgi:hypothetical protein
MRVGKSKISILRKPEHGRAAVRCQRLSDSWLASFTAMRNAPSVSPSEVKQAASDKLTLFGLKEGDGKFEITVPVGHEGTFSTHPQSRIAATQLHH